MRRLIGLLALALAGPAVAQDAAPRELTTDRPDKTEAPQTVPAGHVQVELDLATFTRDRADGVRTDTVSVLPFNLKYGVGDDTDLQLIVAPYLHQIARDQLAGTRERTAGFGDVTLRVKHNLWGNDGGKTAFGLIPFVTLPTSRHDLGVGKVEAGLIAPVTLALSDAIQLGAMTEVDLADADGRYAARFVNSASLGFSPSDKLRLYTELYTERETVHHSGWVATGDAGATYQLTDTLQLDGGVNLGLTHAADNVEVFVGVSRRF